MRSSTIQLGDPAVTLGSCLPQSWHKHIGDLDRARVRRQRPHSITVTYLQLGDVRMLAWPGEPTTTLGFDLKRCAECLGAGADKWISRVFHLSGRIR